MWLLVISVAGIIIVVFLIWTMIHLSSRAPTREIEEENLFKVSKENYYTTHVLYEVTEEKDRMWLLLMHDVSSRRLGFKEQFIYSYVFDYISGLALSDNYVPYSINVIEKFKTAVYKHWNNVSMTSGTKQILISFFDPWLNRLNVVHMSGIARKDELKGIEFNWLKSMGSDCYTEECNKLTLEKKACQMIHKMPDSNVISGVPTNYFGSAISNSNSGVLPGLDLVADEVPDVVQLLLLYMPDNAAFINAMVVEDGQNESVQYTHTYQMASSSMGACSSVYYDGNSVFKSYLYQYMLAKQPSSIHLISNTDAMMFHVFEYCRSVRIRINLIQNYSNVNDVFFSPFVLASSEGDGNIYYAGGTQTKTVYLPSPPMSSLLSNVSTTLIVKVSPRIDIYPFVIGNRLYMVPFSYYGNQCYHHLHFGVGINANKIYPRVCFIPGDCNYILTSKECNRICIRDNNNKQQDITSTYDKSSLNENLDLLLQNRTIEDKYNVTIGEFSVSFTDAFAVFG